VVNNGIIKLTTVVNKVKEKNEFSDDNNHEQYCGYLKNRVRKAIYKEEEDVRI